MMKDSDIIAATYSPGFSMDLTYWRVFADSSRYLRQEVVVSDLEKPDRNEVLRFFTVSVRLLGYDDSRGGCMRIVLTVIAGPHKGREFAFDRHDTFLVGRSRHAHFRLPAKDKYFSRVHFMLEVNPPECRLIDMGSHNGTYVNGEPTLMADLKDGDQIRAGHTMLRVRIERAAGTPAPSAPRAEQGLPSVAGFALEKELGRGAMGVTYQGKRVGDNASVAVKIVTPKFAGTTAQVDEFLRAARALTRLDHPHIVRLLGVGPCAGGFFFVTELVPGRNVADILKREGPLPIARALRLGDQLLAALEHGHAQGFLHMDIKPTNVLVQSADGKDKMKLADYALARTYQAAPFSGLSVTTAMLELASFMPPELLFSYQNVTPLADQYSAAAILYHLLTAAPLLEMPRERRRRYTSLLRRACVPIRERRPEVPEGLAKVLHKALSRTPSYRFGSITEFRKTLAAV